MKYIYCLIYILLLLIPSKVNGQVIGDSLYSNALASNLINEPSTRDIIVYLPPHYEESPSRHYPVLILLHSFGSDPSSWLGENGYEGFNIASSLDSLITAEIISPMIVVMPNAHTKFGGSWYTNSPAGGNWIDFISDDLINYIDGKYRTIRDRGARGITGQSMGGYGALLIAMSRPDVFGTVLGMSSPNLVNPDPFGYTAHEIALSVDKESIESAHILGRLFWSKAIAFSPHPESPPFFADLPVSKNNQTIERNEAVWEKWLEYALINRVDNYQRNLKQLHIRLDVGNKDPLIKETEQLSERLSELNIDNELVIFEGDHVNGVRRQFESSVLYFFHNFFEPSVKKDQEEN